MNACSGKEDIKCGRETFTVYAKPAAIAIIFTSLLVISWYLPAAVWLHRLLDWIGTLGVLGPFALGVAYVMACILLVPGFLLTLGAGALFGVVTGFVTISLSSTLGATVAFLAGRYIARDAVARRAAQYPTFEAIDRAIGQEGWKIVGLVRLSPLLPFNLVNYLFGVTRVSLRDYVLASWIGMMPGTLLYVYLGSLVRDIALLGNTSSSAPPMTRVFYALGFGATLAVTLYISRVARRALSEVITKDRDPR